MINKDYLNNIPVPTTNTLHNFSAHSLTDTSTNVHSLSEFDNLVYNSNLENSNTIK